MRWLLLLVSIPACFSPNLGDHPFTCGPQDQYQCPSGYSCDGTYCVKNAGGGVDAGHQQTADAPLGSADAEADALAGADAEPPDAGAPDAITCTPNTDECVGDDVVSCDGLGNVTSDVHCPAGCNPSGPTCWTLSATNVNSRACDDLGTGGDVDLTEDAKIDADNCILSSPDFDLKGVIVTQSSTTADDLCVLTVHSLTVEQFVTLRATTTGQFVQPVVIVATGGIEIDGTLDASAMGVNDGPGGSFQHPGVGITDGGSASAGGGGAGFGTTGADGAADDFGALAGPAYGNASLVPLVGGSVGGWGGDVGNSTIAEGGGAGGALQIVACQGLTIGPQGQISAVGGGGEGGPSGGGYGGGGGGSGGAILIEAPEVYVPADAVISANGGAGGGGAYAVTVVTANGLPGDDGSLTTGGASGGQGAGMGAGAGGDGGAVARPTQGGTSSLQGQGGGGGASGRIRINTRSDRLPRWDGVISPSPSTGSIGRH